jgi:hypothetical protein
MVEKRVNSTVVATANATTAILYSMRQSRCIFDHSVCWQLAKKYVEGGEAEVGAT